MQFQITYQALPAPRSFGFVRLPQPNGRARHGAREPRPQRGPVNLGVALALAVAWSALARAPQLPSLFDVNHVGVGVGVLRVVCLLSSTNRCGVLSWDPPRRAGPNGDAALRRMFHARCQPGPYVPRCALVATPPEATNMGPGFNRGSGGGARGCGFEERAGGTCAYRGGSFPIAHDASVCACVCRH